MDKQIRVTIEDLETGDKEVVEVGDDYLLICAGRCYEDGIQTYPTKGTHIITVRNVGATRG